MLDYQAHGGRLFKILFTNCVADPCYKGTNDLAFVSRSALIWSQTRCLPALVQTMGLYGSQSLDVASLTYNRQHQ